MSFTNYLEQKVLDYVFNGVAYTPPATWYVSLLVDAPTDTTAGVEMAGGSWGGREVISFAVWNSTDGVANDNEITFTAAADDVVAVGLYDALTGGNLVSYKVLDVPRTYTDGDPVTISVGDLKQMLD